MKCAYYNIITVHNKHCPSFSIVCPTLWNLSLPPPLTHTPEIRLVLNLSAFYKALKNWLCHWMRGSQCVTVPVP